MTRGESKELQRPDSTRRLGALVVLFTMLANWPSVQGHPARLGWTNELAG